MAYSVQPSDCQEQQNRGAYTLMHWPLHLSHKMQTPGQEHNCALQGSLQWEQLTQMSIFSSMVQWLSTLKSSGALYGMLHLSAAKSWCQTYPEINKLLQQVAYCCTTHKWKRTIFSFTRASSGHCSRCDYYKPAWLWLQRHLWFQLWLVPWIQSPSGQVCHPLPALHCEAWYP